MTKDPFYYQLDADFRGTYVRVHTSAHTYERWAREWHYDQHAILLYDAVRDDGEEVGPVTINEPETVARIESGGPIREIAVDAIQPSPYNAREYDNPDHQQFVKQTRERGHLLTFPPVRPVSEDEYETVGGHKRMEAVRRAGLDEIAVRVLDLDDWEAARKFVDEHIPIEGGDERGMYGQEEIDHAIGRLRKEWPDDCLRELTPLTPYLEEKLASTRREAVRQGYAADGGSNR
jgi:hypothetical protein